jgi:hypothetical protein
MDAQLAQIYGTGNNADDDQVKLAAAELLVKLAADNGVDLTQFSDAEVVQMVEELQKNAEFPPAAEKKEEKKESKETPESKESSSESSESGEKAAAEKVAEADFLGRVMAHSFNQELVEIQKEAGIKDSITGAAKKIPEFIRKRMEATGQAAKSVKSTVGSKLMSAGDKARAVGQAAKKSPELAVGAAGAVGGTAAAVAHKGKEKKSSAIEALAEERAFELAKEAGWVDAEGNLLVPKQEEKVASPLDLEVERRALQLLEAQGLPVQWNE